MSIHPHSFVLLYLYLLPNVGIDHPTVMSLFFFFFLSRREHYYREFSAVGGQRILKSTACVARWPTCCQPLICFVFSTSLYRSAIDTILGFLFVFFLVYFCSQVANAKAPVNPFGYSRDKKKNKLISCYISIFLLWLLLLSTTLPMQLYLLCDLFLLHFFYCKPADQPKEFISASINIHIFG